MTTATPIRSPSSAPTRAAPRPHPAAPSRMPTHIDPFRVLRRYYLVVAASAVVGAVVGVGAYVLLGMFYPLYTGEVLYEIRPGVTNVRDVGASDIFQDQLVLRIGTTETVLLTSRGVIVSALRDPQVRATQWFRKGYIGEDGTEQIDEAADDLLEELRPNVLRNTNLFGLKWSTHQAADIPVLLNAIGRSYLDRRKVLDDRTYAENLDIFQRELSKTRRDIEDLDQEISRYIREQGMGTLTDPRDSQVAYAMTQLAT